MIKILSLILLLVTSCGGGGSNNITEVGNPSKGSTATGTTQALVNLNEGLVSGLGSETGALFKRVLKVETDDNYDCSYDETGDLVTCSCPGGGTTTQTFDSDISDSESLIVLNADVTISFNDCVVSACDEDVTFNGDVTGTLEGQLELQADTVSIEVVYSTAETCSGLTAGESDVGFSMTGTFDGTTESFSGSTCIDDEIFTFDTLDELIAAADEDNVCSE